MWNTLQIFSASPGIHEKHETHFAGEIPTSAKMMLPEILCVFKHAHRHISVTVVGAKLQWGVSIKYLLDTKLILTQHLRGVYSCQPQHISTAIQEISEVPHILTICQGRINFNSPVNVGCQLYRYILLIKCSPTLIISKGKMLTHYTGQ
jgi:hypothetical protein